MAEGLIIAILAAGASRRLGQPKQFVSIDGEPLIRRQCRIAMASRIGAITVICGHETDACIAAISDLPLSIHRNAAWREGIACSIRRATQAAIEQNAAGLLILHGDQYRVSAEDLRALHAAWIASGSTKACRSRCEDYVGPPVVLPAPLFGELAQLREDQGARSVLSKLDANGLIDVAMPNAAYDLDLPAQLSALSHG